MERPDTTYLDFTTCDSLLAGIFEAVYLAQSGCDSIVIETNSFLPSPETPVIPADLVIFENEPPFEIMIPADSTVIEYLWTFPAGVQILFGAGTKPYL